jgi:glycosyltransferase involved in cell wall biosynthesis
MTAIYSLASQCNQWDNTQLLKECGLVPFMLHKNFGYKAVMVGEKAGDYPYLQQLPGLEMEFIPSSNGNEEVFIINQINYINENYPKMDVLILRGLYPVTCFILQAYRKKRPDGKVFLYLDANAWWMDNIPWKNPLVYNTLNGCDLISTSCLKMSEFLNKKWPDFIVEHIPNGFFNKISVSIQKKENIILTAGRIGTEQKANDVLMTAFASVADKLPSWKLRLAGPVQEEFSKFTDNYFKELPHLKKRIEFLGNITDKEKLYAEYSRAKIFALTSINEGGAPNVIAEALFHGCFTVTSEIDAARDITNDGKCGRSFPIGDFKALSEIFLKICPDEKIWRTAAENSIKYAKSHYDWDLIANRINYLLFKRF